MKKALPRIVQMDDIHIFGRKLAARLRIEVNRMLEFTKVVFMVQGVGQSSNAQNMVEVLKRFDMEQSLEVVLHVAIDIYEEGHGLFWRKNKVVEHSKWRLFAEYYPLCLGKAGNFYLTVPGQQLPLVPDIRMVRFYNACLKNVHRVEGEPFKKSGFGSLFWKTMFKPKPYFAAIVSEIQNCSTALDVIVNNINVLKAQNYYRARTEFIVSTLLPGYNVVQESISLAQEKFMKNELYSFKMFVRMPITEVVERVQNYLDPALFTIVQEMRKCLAAVMDSEVNSEPYSISADHMHTICACEAIVSFFAFGTAVSIRGDRRHSYALCKKLGLIGKMFANKETRENLFQHCISYNENGTMKYCISEGEMIPDLFYLAASEGGLLKLNDLLTKLNKNWETPLVNLLAIEYVKYILEIGATQKSKMRFDRQRPCHATSKLIREKSQLVCASEFVNRILKTPGRAEYRRMALVATNSVIQKFLGVANYVTWKRKLATGLEVLMWKEMSWVVFPLSSKLCLVTMPFEEYPGRVNRIQYLGYANLARTIAEKHVIGNTNLTGGEKCRLNLTNFKMCWIKALKLFEDYDQDVISSVKLSKLLHWVVKWCVLGHKPTHQKSLFSLRQ